MWVCIVLLNPTKKIRSLCGNALFVGCNRPPCEKNVLWGWGLLQDYAPIQKIARIIIVKVISYMNILFFGADPLGFLACNSGLVGTKLAGI